VLVSAEDGLVVAEQLMEGIKGGAVAALAASLAGRLRRRGSGRQGTSVLASSASRRDTGGARRRHRRHSRRGGRGPDVNIGLVRLELLRAAEPRYSPHTRAVESWTLQP